MSRRRKTMLIFCIIIAVIGVGVLSIKGYYMFKEKKAIQIAQEYLDQKYDQDMLYENIRHPWVDPAQYYVRFSPSSNPKIIFDVIVQPSLSIREDVWDFGKSSKSADNYYVKYFEHCMEEYLVTDVKRLWGDEAAISVLDVNNVAGVVFSVSSELSDEMTIAAMEPLVNDYWIYIRTNDGLIEESVESNANQIFEFIQIIKGNGFEPKTISFSYPISEAEAQSVRFENWGEVDSVDQIIAQLKLELGNS